jgi:DNA-binding MarR family transcriptional regulator/N-acetylglutamate synthase-like GNAT family acetyltransferase
MSLRRHSSRTAKNRVATDRVATDHSATDRIDTDRIATVRRFNRFYTRQIGVLRKNFLDSPYSLGEARVLYEIASGHSHTASDIGRALDLDAGYLSRLLRNFERDGLIRRTTSAQDARQSHLALSDRGRKAYAPLERRSQRNMAEMLDALSAADQARLIAAMNTIEALLGEQATARQPDERTYRLRDPVPGDFGWIVKRHAELYAQEYGWGAPFEGVCAKIVADFANKNDPACERCWIAEMDGENAGCVFNVRDTAEVARIRLLIVDPKARGLKLGARLVDECIRFARAAGYKKITLWTHSVLKAARHIYQKAGFRLMRTERHRSWGRPVVSEFWDLEL